jgi:hypothetical protein
MPTSLVFAQQRNDPRMHADRFSQLDRDRDEKLTFLLALLIASQTLAQDAAAPESFEIL